MEGEDFQLVWFLRHPHQIGADGDASPVQIGDLGHQRIMMLWQIQQPIIGPK